MTAVPDLEPGGGSGRFGRLPPPLGSPEIRRRRNRKVAVAILVAFLATALVLLTVPLSTATRVAETTNMYAIPISQQSPGAQQISVGFATLCDESTTELPIVGNQTFWLTWSSSNSAAISDVKLASFESLSPTIYYDVSSGASGGYAQTSTTTFDWVCASDLTLFANSNTSLTLVVHVGVVYDYTAHVPVL